MARITLSATKKRKKSNTSSPTVLHSRGISYEESSSLFLHAMSLHLVMLVWMSNIYKVRNTTFSLICFTFMLMRWWGPCIYEMKQASPTSSPKQKWKIKCNKTKQQRQKTTLNVHNKHTHTHKSSRKLLRRWKKSRI